VCVCVCVHNFAYHHLSSLKATTTVATKQLGRSRASSKDRVGFCRAERNPIRDGLVNYEVNKFLVKGSRPTLMAWLFIFTPLRLRVPDCRVKLVHEQDSQDTMRVLSMRIRSPRVTSSPNSTNKHSSPQEATQAAQRTARAILRWRRSAERRASWLAILDSLAPKYVVPYYLLYSLASPVGNEHDKTKTE